MKRDDHLLLVGLGTEQADPAQFGHPGRLLGIVIGHLVLDRTGQQSERVPESDVLGIEVARRRGKVMRGHRGQAQLPPPLGLQGAAGSGVDFEPQDGRAEQPAIVQDVPRPGLDGAQVLADNHRAGPVRFQCDDPDHRLVVVAHVDALGRRRSLGNPPQAEHADDVVDPNPAGVPQDGRDQRPERLVAKLFQPVRPPRGL